jgi:hypothetical protein
VRADIGGEIVKGLGGEVKDGPDELAEEFHVGRV